MNNPATGWKRLQTRLTATYLLLAFLLLGSTGYIFSTALGIYAREVQASQITAVTAQVRQVLAESAGRGDSPDEIRLRLEALIPGAEVTLVGQAGHHLEERLHAVPAPLAPPAAPVPQPPQPPAAPLPPGLPQPRPVPGDPGKDSAAIRWLLDGSAFKPETLAMPIPLAQPIDLRLQLQPIGATILSAMLGRIMLVLVLALLAAVVIAWWFSRWVAGPLSRLAGATAAVAGGDFPQTVEPVGIAELDLLTGQFNTMVLRLRESFRSLAAERDVARRFAADAAHELRTPVTALRTYQELAAEDPGSTPQVLPAIARQVQRLEHIVHGLVQMAALSEGTGPDLVPHDLGEAVRGLMPGLKELAEGCGHALAFDLPAAPLLVRLDSHLLEHILFNLVDNACKYTPPGGRLGVTVAEDAEGPRLTVSDNGPGIPADEIPHLFERFHRGMETQSVPGSGLGLAITREAAERLGGTVSVESAPGEGSRFTVRFCPAR